MASRDQTRPSGRAPDTEKPDPSAPPEGRDSDGEKTLAYAEASLTLITAWLDNLRALALLELNRSLTAGKRILALQLLLLPLAVALVLSLCGGAGLIAYRFSQSIYVGFSVFVLAQSLVLAAILLYQRKLGAMLGFRETRRQAKAAVRDVTGLFK